MDEKHEVRGGVCSEYFLRGELLWVTFWEVAPVGFSLYACCTYSCFVHGYQKCQRDDEVPNYEHHLFQLGR
jgi:hypothetical protein